MDKELQSITDCPQKLSTQCCDVFFWTHSPFVVLFSSLKSNAIAYYDVIPNGKIISLHTGGQLLYEARSYKTVFEDELSVSHRPWRRSPH
jgi:hypothetical protein